MKSSYGWDRILVTCGDNKQKKICEELLKSLPGELYKIITIVPDDACNNRIGSGGSLLSVIRSFCSEGEKVLVVNSGGASKRCINYALRGKAFAETYCNGELKTLLEIIIEEYSELFSAASSGIAVCCSDIIVRSNDRLTDFSENIGFSCRTDFETGSRHGVMLRTDDGYLDEFVHKRPSDELKSKTGSDYVLSDTGLVYFTDEFVTALRNTEGKYNIVNTLRESGCEFNLYPDIMPLLGKNKSSFFGSEDTPVQKDIKEKLLKELCGFGMKVCDLKDEPFIHFGTVRESRKNIIDFSGSPDYVLLNSIAETKSVGRGSVIENSFIDRNSSVGRNCFISDVSLYGASVPDNKLVCGFYTDDSYCITVICDIDENPKEKINGIESGKIKRFYKGFSFTDSLNKFYGNSDEEKFSMEEAVAASSENRALSFASYISERKKCIPSEKYISARNKILDSYFSALKSADEIKIKKDRVSLSLPVRVNLSGTWTDAMPYCIDNGGGVVNMAVTVDGKKPVEITLEKISGNKIELVNDGKKRLLGINGICGNTDDEFDEFRLHTAVLRMTGINASTRFDSAFRFSINVSGIMSGSGLGTSSILLGGCFRALGEFFGIEYSDEDILYSAFAAEQLMKTGGGWQDQAGGLFPGIKYTSSVPGLRQLPDVKKINCDYGFLKGRIALVSTRQRHFGRFVVTDVMNRYIEGNADTLEALRQLSLLNEDTIASIKNNDINALCSCVNRQWEFLKHLSPLITDNEIDAIANKCRAISDAVCICGAGAGGYLFLILKENPDFSSFDEPVIPIEICD